MDYKDLNFKCGLEIHRQLETHKLFCYCPSILTEEKPNKIVKRKLHASKGETDETDIAAEFEAKQHKTFYYNFHNESNCLVDLDEEPPHEINQEALKIVLQVALILKCKIVDELQVMRKTIVDGSNTSAFQRTIMVAHSGLLETSKGPVKIEFIGMEEESARKIKEDKNEIHYNLDRLGIPLIEIATDASIKDPQHAKEVAEKLGMILKSTGKVRSGIGTIRQDVNISINNGNRVEIKGFQDLKILPKLIETEIKRQQKEKFEPHVRQPHKDGTSTFLRPMPSAARMYPETDTKTFPITKELLKSIELPELISEKTLKLEKELNLTPELAREVIKQKINLENYNFKNLKSIEIARILIEIPKDLSSRLKLDIKKLKQDDFQEVLEKLNNNEINKDAVQEILKEIIETGKANYEKYKKVDKKELEEEIIKIIEQNKNSSINALMGIAMAKLKGKANGKEVMEILRKHVDR